LFVCLFVCLFVVVAAAAVVVLDHVSFSFSRVRFSSLA
jgi:hypothetical protein